MIRIAIEILLVFLLPTIGYVAWTAFKLREWPGLAAVLADAPLVKLFIGGAVLMLGALAIVATREIDAGRKSTGISAPPSTIFTPETPTPRKP